MPIEAQTNDDIIIPRKVHTLRTLTLMPSKSSKTITERTVRVTLPHVSFIDGPIAKQ